MTDALADAGLPHSREEKWLAHAIRWSFAYYLVGGLYVLGPVLGWAVLLMQARRDGLRGLSFTAWSWVVGMLVMLVTVVVAHADHQLGLGPTIKSSIGWAKGWALMAVFIVIGFGSVRIEVLSRAVCWLGVQTLFLFPLLWLAWAVGMPGHLYVSPLSVVGGPGPEYFSVELFGINPQTGQARWRLFAPWAPAMGLIMSCFVLIAWHERRVALRWAGILGMLLAVLASGSRLGLLALPIVVVVLQLWQRMDQAKLYFWFSPLFLVGGLFAQSLLSLVEDFTSRFHGARADSSRVRAALGRIAVHRWETEAYWWGHGSVERGPHLVEHMPIGSHHTWFGLLFVKGMVGFLALAVPMLMSLWVLLWRGRSSKSGQSAMGILLVLGLYSMSENLEMLAYLYWPALVTLGMGLRDAAFSSRSADCHTTGCPPSEDPSQPGPGTISPNTTGASVRPATVVHLRPLDSP